MTDPTAVIERVVGTATVLTVAIFALLIYGVTAIRVILNKLDRTNERLAAIEKRLE